MKRRFSRGVDGSKRQASAVLCCRRTSIQSPLSGHRCLQTPTGHAAFREQEGHEAALHHRTPLATLSNSIINSNYSAHVCFAVNTIILSLNYASVFLQALLNQLCHDKGKSYKLSVCHNAFFLNHHASWFTSWGHLDYSLFLTGSAVMTLPQPFTTDETSFDWSNNAELWHREESTTTVQRLWNRIHHQHNAKSAKRWLRICFISAELLYILVPFPLCYLVCLPLECWQTVDAACCGDAESVGVDGQDYATQRSRCLLHRI